MVVRQELILSSSQEKRLENYEVVQRQLRGDIYGIKRD